MHLSALPVRLQRALALVFLIVASGCLGAVTPPRDTATADPTPMADPRRPAPALSCPTPAGASARAEPQGNPGARRGAQRGLAFVAKEAQSWQEEHKCYGCHVQAVTLEALSIGQHNQYEVPKADMAAILAGLTTISGGSRGPSGLSVGGSPSHLIETSKEFGGAAFARYDALVGSEARDDLLKVAAELASYQDADGSLRTSDRRFPVEIGPMQATTQAMQTWRQSYERSADDRWLAPLRKAEAWLGSRARALAETPDATIVDLNYAAIGLVSAGAQGTEATMRAIGDRLRSLQGADGGWGFHGTEKSSAFATGQTLYALRLGGASDEDAAIARGTAWLLAHQAEDGGWSHTGSGKAEAMWAVLGLVSIDVLSLDVAGVHDGQHLGGTTRLRARAVDNAGRGVERVEIAIDDVPVQRACGGAAEAVFDASTLGPGRHLIDVTATNARGQTSRRRLEIYAGAYYLTQAATRFTDGGTLVTLRDVAPEGARGSVVLRVFARRDEGGQQTRAERVFRASRETAEGAVSFFWNGTREGGTAAPAGGRYVAEVSFVDATGKTMQLLELPFVHDTPEAQTKKFGEVAGSLGIGASEAAANPVVELVDDQNRVVQRTTTTGQGNYRFRNVDGGSYKVRVEKKGFTTQETGVKAAPATVTPAPKMSL